MKKFLKDYILKIILIIAVAAIGIMLIIAWQYNQQKELEILKNEGYVKYQYCKIINKEYNCWEEINE